jgi:O-antigen/teichoic acid export membrane protein
VTLPDHTTVIARVAGSTAITKRALSGLLWLGLQAVASKGVSILGQILLAYVLYPDDFELIALAFSVVALARVVEAGGIREVLLYRGNEFSSLRKAGFWFSLLLGISASALILLLAPTAAVVYGRPVLAQLAGALAILPILASLSTVPLAQLQLDCRFRVIAKIFAARSVTQTLVTLAAAGIGMRVWSFVVGMLVAEVVALGFAWSAAPAQIGLQLNALKWPALWRGAFPLAAVSLVTVVIQQVDYMVLGMLHADQLGYYYFAYNLSSQPAQLIGAQIATVMLPLLCSISTDASRQLRGTLRAFHILSAICFPIAFLQVALADPLFSLVLPHRWLHAVPYAQILSLGLGINILSSVCWASMKAQGRFWTVWWLTAGSAVLFCAAIVIAARLGTAIAVAWCVVGLCLIYTPLLVWTTIRPLGGNVVDALNVFRTPAICGTVALVVSRGVDAWLNSAAASALVRAVIISGLFAVIYLGSMRAARHPTLMELLQSLGQRFAHRQSLGNT